MKPKTTFKIVFALALAVLVYLGVALGASVVSWKAPALALSKGLQLLDLAEPPSNPKQLFQQSVVWNVRLPRVLLGVLVGAGLGISGTTLQCLFRNPLADPGVVGISSGCAFGAVMAIVLGHSTYDALHQAHPMLASFWVVVSAFGTGMLTVLFVLALSKSFSGLQTHTFLLAGIAVGSLAMAGVGLVLHLADDLQIRELTFWQMGSLGRTNWLQVQVAALLILVPSAWLLTYARSFNVYLLGDAEAKALGVQTERMKALAVLGVAIIVASSVSFSGIIAFVGLVVPHILRLSIGTDHRQLLPYSCVVGALLLLAADLGSRLLLPPIEISLGVLTALLGAPVFLFLILKSKSSYGLRL